MTVHEDDSAPQVGVGPWEGPWPEGEHYDAELLREGDRRNVTDNYRYWTLEAIVAAASDILEELGSAPLPESTPASAPQGDFLRDAVNPENSPILEALGHDPCTLDDLVNRTALGADQLLPELLTLELSGQIASLPGNRYQRLA